MVEWKVRHKAFLEADVSPGWHLEVIPTQSGYWCTVAYRGLRVAEWGLIRGENLLDAKKWCVNFIRRQAERTLEEVGNVETVGS